MSFTLKKGDKAVFVGDTELAVTTLFRDPGMASSRPTAGPSAGA